MQKQAELKLNHIYPGDALDVLQTFPDECVDTIITSPPYWGLRDYHHPKQLGLEKTLEEYLEKCLDITQELKRVLKPEGLLFWVHGNSYSGDSGKKHGWSDRTGMTSYDNEEARKMGITFDFNPEYSIRRKCLTNQNYRLAILMQDKQGWIQRNEIVWAKPNYTPSGSIRDRFTNSHESIFMFSKEEKYYFDIESIRIPYTESGLKRKEYQHTLFSSDPNCKESKGTKGLKQGAKPKTVRPNKHGKKPHDVWTISPASGTKEKHFACVDINTEILTISGWKKNHELKLEQHEKVATYSLEKKIIEWQPIVYIKEYEFDGELISVGNRDIDILMTSNHRNIVSKIRTKKENNKKTYFRDESIVRADELAYSDKIRVRAPFDFENSTEKWYNYSVGETWAELVGFIISEGNYYKNAIRLYQNKGENEKRIDYLLKKAEIPHTKTERNKKYKDRITEEIVWYFKKCPFKDWLHENLPTKELTKQLVFLPKNELKALFNGLVSGDGNIRKDGRIQFIQKSKKTIDWFQVIAFKLGFHCIISKRKNNDIYQAFLTKREHIGIRKTNGLGKNIRRIKYKGKIWCPKTANTTWVARRNGRIFITGNTFPPPLILPMIKGTCPLWVCKECGKPRHRIVKKTTESESQEELNKKRGEYAKHQLTLKKPPNKDWQSEWITLGWTDCGCGKGFESGVVLDPFFGRGTTALVAQREKRNWVGIELNPKYISIAEDYLDLKRNLNRFLKKEVA